MEFLLPHDKVYFLLDHYYYLDFPFFDT